MNKTLMIGLVLAVVALAGVAYVYAFSDAPAAPSQTTTCGAQGCQFAENGGCAAQGGCGMAGCAASSGGTCGCGK